VVVKVPIEGVIIFILLVAAAFGTGFLKLPGSFSMGDSGQGFTTLSLSGGSAADGEVCLLWAADGSGGSASGIFSPAEIKAFTGVQPAGPFTFTTNLTDAQCRNQFRETGQIIKKVDAYQTDYWKSRDGMPTCTPPSYVSKHNSVCEIGYFTEKVGDCAKPNNDGLYPTCKCNCAKLVDVGVAYKLESFPVVEYGLNVSLNVGGQEYSTLLDNTHKSGTTAGVTHKTIGGLQGDIDCGTISADIVAFIPKGKNEVQIKDFSAYDRVVSQEPSSYNAYQDKDAYNSIVNSFLNSQGDIGQLCELTDVQAGLNEATVSCRPKGQLTIPLGMSCFPAALIQAVTPSSSWEILGASAISTDAAKVSTVKVDVHNAGGADASADVSLQGPTDASPFSSRAFIKAGETKAVYVQYAGAGLIDDYLVKVTDVNEPSSSASTTVRLEIDPFCSSSSPGPAFLKVSTMAGCTYYCGSSIYSSDLVSNTCQPIKTYDRCTLYEVVENGTSCKEKEDLEGLHCTGIGKYDSMNSYADYVFEGGKPYIPEKKVNQDFVTYADGKMICDYVWDFGYGPDGELDSARADYTLEEAAASEGGDIGDVAVDEIEDKTGLDLSFLPGFAVLGIFGILTLVGAFLLWRHYEK